MKLEIKSCLGDMEEIPDAKSVRSVLGHVDIGTHRVAFVDPWGHDRFPWRVYGPANRDGFREILDDFPQYKMAVAFAKKEQR